MSVFTRTAMNIQDHFSQLSLEGEIHLDSPHGSAHFKASRSEEQIRLHFENAPTFRYFLSTVLPQVGLSGQRQLLKSLQALPQALSVTLAGQEMLSSTRDGGLKVNYFATGLQWLRWRLSRLF
ncbi:MAG: hypothetical protein RIC19_17730 [Phaeodactylibacter sp.]|uniref:hypothetical protein n=1 Tax=Phaeodactylibacter sp. TaxID=1940289 RepID=UPI0032EE114D